VDDGVINLKGKSHWAGLDVGDIYLFMLYLQYFTEVIDACAFFQPNTDDQHRIIPW